MINVVKEGDYTINTGGLCNLRRASAVPIEILSVVKEGITQED